MIKKKAKGKRVAKKSGKKEGAAKKGKEPNPVGVRKEISLMVESEATVIARAVIDEGKKGQLATAKYLFEMASIFPGTEADGLQATSEEDCFAKTLLHRLNLPQEPVKRDEDEAAKPEASVEAKPESKAEAVSVENPSV
jgi:hypothetical protein